MKLSKRSQQLNTRASPEFFELIDVMKKHFRFKDKSIADIIHSAVAHEARSWMPWNENTMRLIEIVADQDTNKRRREALKVKNKKSLKDLLPGADRGLRSLLSSDPEKKPNFNKSAKKRPH
jgi:uncharacterized protein YjiS (DUF1127 family)